MSLTATETDNNIDKDRVHRLHKEIIIIGSGVEVAIIVLLETIMIPTYETIGRTLIQMIIIFGSQQNRDRPSVHQCNCVASDLSPVPIKILNFSHRKLKNVEESVLMRGLKFTPTPQRNNALELQEDLYEFTRK